MQGVAKKLRTVHPELFGPALRLGGFLLVDSEAEHCHTSIVVCMTTFSSNRSAEAMARFTVTTRRRERPMAFGRRSDHSLSSVTG